MKIKTLLFILGLLSSINLLFAQNIILHCGNLIDGYSDKTQKEVSIIIENDRIKSIEQGYSNGGESDQTIDLKEYTVMPGFIDMHVHLEHEFKKGSYINRFTMNEADLAFESTVYAERTLMAGFTTVRDLGGSGVNISLRNAINKGLVVGPRIFTAGKALAVTGGHADPTNGMKNSLRGDPGPKEGVVNGIADARKAVRQRYKNGADLIKITATGGVMSMAKDGLGPHFKEDEIAAIVSTANDYNFHVAAHAHGAEGMKRAIRAGVTTIEHGTYMDEEAMKLMKENGTYLIATITTGVYVAEKAAIKGNFPEMVAKKAIVIGQQSLGMFERAYKYGVPIGFGTDAGVFPHGLNGREFELMVQGGMKPMESIQTATSINAKILKETDNIGRIKSGLFADIVAIKGDPIKDITLLQNVQFVMKGGEIYKSE